MQLYLYFHLDGKYVQLAKVGNEKVHLVLFCCRNKRLYRTYSRCKYTIKISFHQKKNNLLNLFIGHFPTYSIFKDKNCPLIPFFIIGELVLGMTKSINTLWASQCICPCDFFLISLEQLFQIVVRSKLQHSLIFLSIVSKYIPISFR